MSSVDLVRRAWAAWEVRDMDTVVDCMTPGVVHDLSHYVDDGRITRWEPWSDVAAARAALG